MAAAAAAEGAAGVEVRAEEAVVTTVGVEFVVVVEDAVAVAAEGVAGAVAAVVVAAAEGEEGVAVRLLYHRNKTANNLVYV